MSASHSPKNLPYIYTADKSQNLFNDQDKS